MSFSSLLVALRALRISAGVRTTPTRTLLPMQGCRDLALGCTRPNSSGNAASSSSAFPTSSFVTPPSREEIFAKYPPSNPGPVREAWLEDLGPDDGAVAGSARRELVPLHPDIWSVRPRIDLIQDNVEWQELYKKVSYIHLKTRHELPGKGLRPWPQKGMGKARHASIRSPLWIQGGKARGPRNPRTYYYMLPLSKRVNGLIHTLAVKFAQDDVHVVRDLDIPSADPAYVDELIDRRGWALSTLFVDNAEIFPANLTEATDAIDYVNLMPSYGLNVHSMLKHKTLVLTTGALNHLEDRLLRALYRADGADAAQQNYDPTLAPRPVEEIEPPSARGEGTYHRPMPGDEPHRPILW